MAICTLKWNMLSLKEYSVVKQLNICKNRVNGIPPKFIS